MSLNRRNFLHQSGKFCAAIYLFPKFLGGCRMDNPMKSDDESQFRVNIIFTTDLDFKINLPNGTTTSNLNDFPRLFKASLQDIDTDIENFVISLSEEEYAEVDEKRQERGATKIMVPTQTGQVHKSQVPMSLPNGLQLRVSTKPETHYVGGCIRMRVPHYNYALHRPTSESAKGKDIFNLHVAAWQKGSKYCAAFYVKLEETVSPTIFSLVVGLANTLFLRYKVKFDQDRKWICVKECFTTESKRDAWLRQHLGDAFEMVEMVEKKVLELIFEAVVDESMEALDDVVKLGKDVLVKSVKGVSKLVEVLALGLVGVVVGRARHITQIGTLTSVIKTVLSKAQLFY